MTVCRSRRQMLKALGGIAVGFSFSACTDTTAEPSTLTLYNWDDYLDPAAMTGFSAETGQRVRMRTFATNEELYEQLHRAEGGYDVIVPSNDLVDRLIQEGLLAPLDRAKLTNFANIDPLFQDAPYDANRAHSVPYTWATCGIAYRPSKMPGGQAPTSWKVMFDSTEFAGRIALLSEPGLLFRLVAKYLGHGSVPLTPAIITEVEMLLRRQAHNVVFHEDNGQDLIIDGEVDLAIEYNGDVATALPRDSDLAYVIPNEGSELLTDCLCIPKASKLIAEAHAFINHVLDAEVGAANAAYLGYPTPNAAARALMDLEYSQNPVIFHTQADLARCTSARYEGTEINDLVQQAYERVRL